MSHLVLDAGALVAVDRGDRRVGAMLRVAWEAKVPLRASAGVVAQVWRGGPRQARLARVLAGVDVRALDAADARRVGALLALTGASDVVDAHGALDVAPGDRVLTSDPDDLGRALEALGVEATIVRA
ncbi:MAG: hypothetical protein H6735_14030 [Alphaproteobacteria bacterium]|nr:hypothetical protein [Alphaproteobacteria bacterium]